MPRSEEEVQKRKSLRALIAEDIRMNQIIIMEMMNMLGYAATLVENGNEALKQYQEGTYDIIFSLETLLNHWEKIVLEKRAALTH